MLNEMLYKQGLEQQVKRLYTKLTEGDALACDKIQRQLDQSMLSDVSSVTAFSDASVTA